MAIFATFQLGWEVFSLFSGVNYQACCSERRWRVQDLQSMLGGQVTVFNCFTVQQKIAFSHQYLRYPPRTGTVVYSLLSTDIYEPNSNFLPQVFAKAGLSRAWSLFLTQPALAAMQVTSRIGSMTRQANFVDSEAGKVKVSPYGGARYRERSGVT